MLPPVFNAHDAIAAEVRLVPEEAVTTFAQDLSQEFPGQIKGSIVKPQEQLVVFSPQKASLYSGRDYLLSEEEAQQVSEVDGRASISQEPLSEEIELPESEEIRQVESLSEQPQIDVSSWIEVPTLPTERSQELSAQVNLPVVEPQGQSVTFSPRESSLTPGESQRFTNEQADEALDIDNVEVISQSLTQGSESSELDEARLFEQVFGKPQGTDLDQIEVPLILNGRSHGNIIVHPHSEVARVTVAANAFWPLAQDTLNETVQANLKLASDSDGQLSLLALQAEGLEAHFDRRQLQLHIDVPPDLRLASINSIGESSEQPNESELTLPGQLSGYLNLRGSQTINWAGEDTGLKPLGLQLDGAINWQGWVLEAQGQATLGQSWQLDRLSIVRDAPEQAIRYTIGDLSVSTAGYQTSPSMFGVSVARNFSLQPFRVARPTSNYSFFLERASTVDVFVNDELKTTLRLEAGPQDIRDLPLKTGINDIRLEITDDLGQTETLNFSTGVAGELLAEGVHQFAYSAGFPTIEQQPFKSYDLSRPTLSLFHRVGLTPNLTLGGYLQGDTTQQMVGTDGTWATKIGNLGWDIAASHHTDYGVDIAAKLFYEWIEAPDQSSQQRRLRTALEYRGEEFSVLGQESPDGSTALNLSIAYQQVLFENIRASVNGEYQISRQENNAYNIGVNLSRPFGQGLNLNLGYNYGQDSSRQTNHRFSIGLSGALPFAGQRFNTRTEFNNTLEPNNALNWSYSPSHTLGNISPNLTLTQSPERYGLNGRLQYQGYRNTLGLNHQFTLPRETDGSIENSSTVTWGTAIAFVDGVWGWSRPIDNSFALVTRQGSAVGNIVRVNPTLSGDMAQANGSGPAVLSVAPYSLSRLSLDAPDLSLGEDLGQTSHQLLPTYRSGTLIRTGTEATVFLRGVLIDNAQKPISLQQGWIKSLSDPDWPTADFFTNRTGRFAAAGLKPGRYQLQLSSIEGGILEFEISEEQQGHYDTGTLQIPVEAPTASQ